MSRMLIALLAAACQLLAAGKWEQQVERSARLVQARAAAETPVLAVDTYLRTAELMRATHPALARQCVMAALERLKTVEPSSSNELRAMRLLMSLDPVEGERVLLAAPGKTSAYIAVIDYRLGKGEPGRAGERLREAWRNGVWFTEASRMIAKVREKDAAAAVGLYREMLGLLPEEQTTLHANLLAQCSRDMAAQSPEEAKRGFERLLAAVNSAKFNAAGRDEIIATFKLGEKSIQAADTRETFLLPLGLYLRKIDPAAYEKHQQLFLKWRDDIAAVKPEDVERAARPAGMLQTTKEALPKLRAQGLTAPRPPEQKKPPFEEALAKARTAPQIARPSAYMDLLHRDDITAGQQVQAARELLALLPEVPLSGSRLSTASALFQLALDKEWTPIIRPAADVLANSLMELAPAQRTRSDTLRAYNTLATGARRARMKVKLDDFSFAARTALLDLKDLLDQHYDFELATAQGEPFRLAAQRGRVVMLNFWATW